MESYIHMLPQLNVGATQTPGEMSAGQKAHQHRYKTRELQNLLEL